MFPSLAHRPWHVFCRVSLQHRAPLSQRSSRVPQLRYGEESLREVLLGVSYSNIFYTEWLLLLWFLLNGSVGLMCSTTEETSYCHSFCCTGWQSGGIHSLWCSLPDCRVASLGLGKVQYYSTSGNSKDGPPKSASGDAPSAEKVLAAAAKATAASSSEKCWRFCILQKFEMFMKRRISLLFTSLIKFYYLLL